MHGKCDNMNQANIRSIYYVHFYYPPSPETFNCTLGQLHPGEDPANLGLYAGVGRLYTT